MIFEIISTGILPAFMIRSRLPPSCKRERGKVSKREGGRGRENEKERERERETVRVRE